MNILTVLVPIFGLIIAGWILKRVRVLKDCLVRLINNYVYYIGISAIVFQSLHNTSVSMLLDPGIYLLSLLPMLAIVAIAYGVGKLMKLGPDKFAVFVVCALYGNTIYIGLPLNELVQGPGSAGMTAFIATIYTVVVFTLGVHILQRSATEPVEAGKLHKLPVIWAALLGILLSWLALPYIISLPLGLISESTSPLALLATGAMIEVSGLAADLKEIGVLSLLKLVIAPALVVLAGLAAGFSGTAFTTSLLEAATPVGVSNSVMASQFNMDTKFASRAIVISTMLFAVTLTVILLLI